jgi:hypothetical protein
VDVQLGQELLDELGSTLENLETQQGALLQCLKEKGVVSDEELAPFLTQASNASNVRWRAARLRLERILSGAQQKKEEEIKKRRDSPAVDSQSRVEKASGQAGSEVKAEATAEEQKKVEEQKPGDEGAKSREKKRESVESSEVKTGEEAKFSTKEGAGPSKDRETDAA